MKKSILKPIAAGMLIGAIAFIMPFFLLRAFLFILIIGGLIRLFAGRRFGRGFGGARFRPVFADKIRNMSEDEYAQFKQKFQRRCGNGNKETATETK